MGVQGTMPGETDKQQDPDDIPAFWPLNYAFSAKDALGAVSCFAFLAIPVMASFYGVALGFGVANDAPVRDQLHGARGVWYVVATILSCSFAGLAGKYLWLIALCRVLGRVNVGPLIAYGTPRRIGRLDRILVRRLYRHAGPAIETRLLPPRSVSRVLLLHGTPFAAGALLSFGIGFLPLMRGDPRPWQLAGVFGTLAVLQFAAAAWSRRKMR